MGTRDLGPGRDFVRRHHVHYDVRDELVLDGEARRKVGYRIRLWVVLPDSGALPREAVEGPLALDLVALAERLVPAERGEASVHIDPPARAIYASRVVAGADELALDIRLLHGRDGLAPAGAAEERCLRAIRRALEAFGVPQRD